MRKISLLDELGFIPYEKEGIERFEERCNQILSLQDELYHRYGDDLLDSSQAIEVLYRHCRVKPYWIPIIKKPLLFGRGKVETTKIKGARIPFIFVKQECPLAIQIHELGHAFREPLYPSKWRITFYSFHNEILEDEYIASYPCIKEGLSVDLDSSWPRELPLLRSVVSLSMLAMGIDFFLRSLSLSNLLIAISGIYMGIGTKITMENFLALKRVRKLPSYIEEIEKSSKEKTGYLVARLKTPEIENFAKNLKRGKKLEELLNHIPGLRGEIIRYRY
jgi:hypothetical protein